MVTIQEAEERWPVSGRTIRRRLAKGVSGASRTPNGQWLIPTSWLDDEYGEASSTITASEPVIDNSEPVIDSVIDNPEPVIDKVDPFMEALNRVPAKQVAEEEMLKLRAEADEIRERRAAAREAREAGTMTPVIGMTPPVSYDNRPDMSSQLEAKDARIDHLRDQIADLRVEMAGITVEQRYAQIAEKRVTAERDRANSDLEQARSEAERLRIDLTGEQAARTAEAAAAEAMTADKDQEIERQRTKMGELRRELRLAEDQSKRRYRRAKQKEAKRKAKASRKA